MTSIPHYRGINEILRRLDSVHARQRTVRLVTGLAALGTMVFASLVLTTLACGYWPDQPPGVLRWILAAGCLCLWGAVLGAMLFRSVLWRQSPAQTARFIEAASPELRNDLINSVLLAEDTDQVSEGLVQQAIDETVRASRGADLEASVSPRTLKRWGIAAAIAGAVVVALASLQPGPFRRGLMALAAPWKYVAHVNTLRDVAISPGDATVFAGKRVRVIARIEGLADDVPAAGNRVRQLAELAPRVLIEGVEAPRHMLPGQRDSFVCDLGALEQTLRYAVFIGSDRWPTDRPWYQIDVIARIDVEGLDLAYTYPAYTRLEPRTVANSNGTIEAPVGSTVRVTLRLSGAVPRVAIQMKGGPARLMAANGERKAFTADLPVCANGGYRLALQDESGRVIQRLPDLGNGDHIDDAPGAAARLLDGYYPIRADDDAPPRAVFLLPGRDLTVAPGAKVRMKIKVSDKFGLTEMSLLAGKVKARPDPVLARSLDGATEKIIEYEYPIDPALPDDGSVVLEYHATVTDNRRLPRLKLGPQTARSRTFKITVQDAAKLAAEAARRYEQLRKKLLAILKLQLAQRVTTAICWTKHTRLDSVRKSGAEILAGQKAVRDGVLWLLENHKFDQDMLAIQRELAQLFTNEAKTAVDQAQVLTALGAMDDRNDACHKLAGTQDKIITALQSILAIMPELAGKAEKKQPEGGDLPPEAEQKIRDLKNELQKFIEAQKKVIKASERLVKTPADSFQDADEELLKKLIAVEDKWEKFLDEAFTDFSKLAQQDFSNPEMLKELLSVKCDVTMAKDALSKKAAEIATSAEENGVENAKTLTANLEKWLPDTPDRTKWAMEAPEGQDNIEMPELPEELEDLVGDLLEEEEDLFDEMADVSSKATGSFDKGAGWDAMDGPISSMNAQGVTGNQLPNPSEISGRSGEGRQGKATGEFVEDKAVGKGGRRTPTRLTPEPFQKGQVNDTSAEPAGGSTGGGKISGSGSQGLEGPVPPELKKQLDRLAGQQAALINKTERIRAQFKVSDHANLKLFKAVTLMNQVHEDLKQYRYHNALRARDKVLGALKDSSLLLSGDVEVQADVTSAMPKYIRDDIADAMNGALPEEFREALKQYYRRLSRQGR